MHEECLHRWQFCLLEKGKRPTHCDVCKSPWKPRYQYSKNWARDALRIGMRRIPVVTMAAYHAMRHYVVSISLLRAFQCGIQYILGSYKSIPLQPGGMFPLMYLATVMGSMRATHLLHVAIQGFQIVTKSLLFSPCHFCINVISHVMYRLLSPFFPL